MSELAVFQAELERLEREDRWDDPGYDFLASKVEELKTAERTAKPPTAKAPAAGEQDGDPVRALVAEMEAAAANPGRLSDADREALVRRYNTAVDATRDRAEAEDAAEVQRAMLEARADPSKLSDDERAALLARYNRLAVQQPQARADSPDLGERMRAAVQAQERGEQVDVPALLAQFEAWQAERLQAARDPANLPPELQEAGRVLYEAEARMHRPADPVAAAIGDLNAYVRGLKPQTLAEQQLAELGVEVEPESVSTSSTSQEA